MKKLLLAGFALLGASQAHAQILAPVHWSYAAKRLSATEAVVLVRATIDPGWHIYSQHLKDGGPVKTTFTFDPAKNYAVVGAPAEPTPISHFEKSFNMQVSYFEKAVVFQQKVKLAGPGPATVKGKVEFMVCNDEKCLPPDEVAFSVPVK